MTPNWDAAVVTADGRDQPLGAVYRLSLLGLVDELLESGSAGSGSSPSARGRTGSTLSPGSAPRSGA